MYAYIGSTSTSTVSPSTNAASMVVIIVVVCGVAVLLIIATVVIVVCVKRRKYSFLPRDAMHARYILWPCDCVCVCLTQVGVLPKRLNTGSHKENHMTQGV